MVYQSVLLSQKQPIRTLSMDESVQPNTSPAQWPGNQTHSDLFLARKRRGFSLEVNTLKSLAPPHPPRSLSSGLASMVRLLNSAGEESQPGLAVLLCEILTAVFLSLFVHGMATHSSNELFRIVAHPLNSKLWVTVFGGGARTPVIEKRSSPAKTPPIG